MKHFPENWTEGLRSPIFKSGSRSNCDNYRGITVLPVFEKVFESVILNRLQFVSDAFMKEDRFNGGFKKGSRTSDNNFILQGLVQRQLTLGKNLIVIHVDFSRAFDLVNRNILFYKLHKNGFKGRVIETLLSLYNSTSYRVKLNANISETVKENIGVNQGAITSPFLFKQYLADLKNYLDEYTGVCIGEEILVHILWADDLYMVSEDLKCTQLQLNGLTEFSAANQMVVNEIKTRYMVYGNQEISNIDLKLNGKNIEKVGQYKSLGNILSSIKTTQENIFKLTPEYLNSRARQATFGIKNKLKSLGHVPPQHMLYMYESMIEPILLYGSDVWGAYTASTDNMNKIYLWFIRMVLKVKPTTCNIITMGESGIIPPKTKCHEKTILYFIRLNTMSTGSVVKNIFLDMRDFHDAGFRNWYTLVCELGSSYGLDIKSYSYNDKTKINIKNHIRNHFITNWKSDLQNDLKYPILRTYRIIKSEFRLEPYLTLIQKSKSRSAMSQFRAGTHMLEIERGRYITPKIPRKDRTCIKCQGELEDEYHFIMNCSLYKNERDKLFHKIKNVYCQFSHIRKLEQFIFLFNNENPAILSWVGNYINISMEIRKQYHQQ